MLGRTNSTASAEMKGRSDSSYRHLILWEGPRSEQGHQKQLEALDAVSVPGHLYRHRHNFRVVIGKWC